MSHTGTGTRGVTRRDGDTSCHFQKLFGTDGELEDEVRDPPRAWGPPGAAVRPDRPSWDFLSAVEDAENQFVIPGHSSPSVVPVHPSKAPTLRPLAGQGGFQGPPSRGAAPQDELDNDLFLAACRELEGPEAPVGAGAAPLPPRHREKPPWKCPGKENTQECGIPKKLRVGEELVPGSGGVQDSKAPGGPPRAPPRRESRRFPGPAGILPQQHSGKLLEEILVSAPQTPAHGAVAKPRAQALPSSPLPREEDFGKGPWLAMKTELGLDERDPSCFLHTYSVVMVLRKAALKQLPKNKVPSMAVMIKTLTRSSAGAGAVFRDPTGEMQGTVHRLLLEQRQSELRAGSVLLLRQVGVFSPSHRNHYLNVTPNNLLRIFPPEPEGCSPRQVPAQAELIPDPPAQPPQGVLAPEDWGHSRTNGHSAEQHPGGFSLHPPSSGPSWEELVGADGCDMDDLDGLLGELPEDFFSASAQADCG
ncbi:PREDICTED: uncharacterized protein C17orf53 homolog [Corvus brachyrhynchos]|uniref:uncharacterized protein C17orf53 homolog n=1 Tax=Corvus brachyrhynchos TaxID=85066 RepID=UPI0008164C27|nr:PREDICTED: uncharacterized protein C17orf53 homolog [Corvus brachyrhynchos]